MADTENEKLRKEVERQAQIINALLDNNRQLTHALAWCRYLLATFPPPVSANDLGAKPIPQNNNDMAEHKDGVNKTSNSIDKAITGVIKQFDNIEKQIYGVNEHQDNEEQQKVGVNDLQSLLGAQMDGVNHPLTGNGAGAGIPSSENKPIAMPAVSVQQKNNLVTGADIITNYSSKIFYYNGKPVALYAITTRDVAEGKPPVNYNSLYNLLRKKIVRASKGGLVNTAQILMALHESPVQSLKSLQKLTRLSEDGITKRIMAMKKFGLIVRAPGRQLLLTSEARHMLDEARH